MLHAFWQRMRKGYNSSQFQSVLYVCWLQPSHLPLYFRFRGTQRLDATRQHHLTGGTNADERDMRERGENTCTSESQPQSAIWPATWLLKSSPYTNSEWCFTVSSGSGDALKSQILQTKVSLCTLSRLHTAQTQVQSQGMDYPCTNASYSSITGPVHTLSLWGASCCVTYIYYINI
jgi:hypothetical protein